jgi:hypothetical protein
MYVYIYIALQRDALDSAEAAKRKKNTGGILFCRPSRRKEMAIQFSKLKF